MNYSIKFKRSITFCLAFALVVCLLPLSSSAVTVDETESNNTWQTADVTQDDYTNYGVLSSAGDIDWWKVTFNQDGYANFWVDSSAGYNYDLRVYDDTITLLERSINGGRQELVRFNVVAGETYYMRIYVKSGTAHGGQYTMRAKRYDSDTIRVFTVNSGNFNSTGTASAIMQYYWDAGYDGSNYLNNSAASVYNTMATSDVLIAHVRWGPGNLELPTANGMTALYAERGLTNESVDRYIEEMSPGALNDVEMAVFCGDYTGQDNDFTGNLVDMTLAKGAGCAIGWTKTVDVTETTTWLNHFSNYIGVGDKIDAAMKKADDALTDAGIKDSTTSFRYVGSSNVNQVIG